MALKQNPGVLSFGHNGTGTNGDLALQMLSDATGVKLNEVPYKGTAAQKTDVLGDTWSTGWSALRKCPSCMARPPSPPDNSARSCSSRPSARWHFRKYPQPPNKASTS